MEYTAVRALEASKCIWNGGPKLGRPSKLRSKMHHIPSSRSGEFKHLSQSCSRRGKIGGKFKIALRPLFLRSACGEQTIHREIRLHMHASCEQQTFDLLCHQLVDPFLSTLKGLLSSHLFLANCVARGATPNYSLPTKFSPGRKLL